MMDLAAALAEARLLHSRRFISVPSFAAGRPLRVGSASSLKRYIFPSAGTLNPSLEPNCGAKLAGSGPSDVAWVSVQGKGRGCNPDGVIRWSRALNVGFPVAAWPDGGLRGCRLTVG